MEMYYIFDTIKTRHFLLVRTIMDEYHYDKEKNIYLNNAMKNANLFICIRIQLE